MERTNLFDFNTNKIKCMCAFFRCIELRASKFDTYIISKHLLKIN